MYSVKKGLYNRGSPMTQFAKPDSLFTNTDTTPLSNSNLVEESTCETSSAVEDGSYQENPSDDRLSIQK